MNHRISAGALVEHEGRILLVRCVKAGEYDFWVAPGGGVQGAESLEAAAAREVWEETGLRVEIGRLLYIEELFNPACRHLKFWFRAALVGGHLDWSHPEAVSECITEAAWHELDALCGLTVFPPMLTTRYRGDRDAMPDHPVRLALREMSFW